jgi:hypothetical protein
MNYYAEALVQQAQASLDQGVLKRRKLRYRFPYEYARLASVEIRAMLVIVPHRRVPDSPP